MIYREKVRWLDSGWNVVGLATELRRTAAQWVCRSHKLDWERAAKEKIGHAPSRAVVSFLRHIQDLKYSGRLVPTNLTILTITAVDPATKEIVDIDWSKAKDIVSLLFGASESYAYITECRKKGEYPNWQWGVFHDEHWRPRAAPNASLIQGSTYWSMHPENKGELNGLEPS